MILGVANTNPPALQKVIPAYLYHPPSLPPSHSAFSNAAKFGLAGQGPPPPSLEREAQRARMEKARQPRSVRSGLAFRLSFVEGGGGLFFGFQRKRAGGDERSGWSLNPTPACSSKQQAYGVLLRSLV
jgi:hypothetical protein